MELYAYSCTAIDGTSGETLQNAIENGECRDVHWIADDTTVARQPRMKAPRFMELLHHLQTGDRLIVATLQDLGCSAEDVLSTLQALDERQVEIRILELGVASLSSDSGVLIRKMLHAVVEMATQRSAEPVQQKGKTSGRAPRLSRELRARIITEYSQGVAVAELAARHGVSRARIQGIVDPTRKGDEPLPFAWGD